MNEPRTLNYSRPKWHLVVTDNYVVGVDGGATKTVALVGTSEGRVLGRAETGSSNYHNIGSELAGKAVKDAVIRAKKKARLSGMLPKVAVVSLAAVDSHKDIRATTRFVRRVKVAKTSFVIHDSVAALYAATKGNPGIIVNSGTGSFAAGINRSGEYVRVGGWGYLIDDRGSAFDIGIKAIAFAFRMMDGRTPRTRLVNRLKLKLGVRRFDEILDLIYSDRIGVRGIAELAPLVSEDARYDKVCQLILRESGTSLAELACAAARRLKMTKTTFPLSMVGGGFNSGFYFVKAFKSKVREECPRARFIRLRKKEEPAIASYLIATKIARQGLMGLADEDRWLRKVVNR
jgi:N-acetylglucosamine kinase-like BadF-type ATPase